MFSGPNSFCQPSPSPGNTLPTISSSPHIQILPIQGPAQTLHAPQLYIPSWPYKLPQTFSTSLLPLVTFCCTLCNCPIFPSLDLKSSEVWLESDSIWLPTHSFTPSIISRAPRLRNWYNLFTSQHLTQCLVYSSCSITCWMYEILLYFLCIRKYV